LIRHPEYTRARLAQTSDRLRELVYPETRLPDELLRRTTTGAIGILARHAVEILTETPQGLGQLRLLDAGLLVDLGSRVVQQAAHLVLRLAGDLLGVLLSDTGEVLTLLRGTAGDLLRPLLGFGRVTRPVFRRGHQVLLVVGGHESPSSRAPMWAPRLTLYP